MRHHRIQACFRGVIEVAVAGWLTVLSGCGESMIATVPTPTSDANIAGVPGPGAPTSLGRVLPVAATRVHRQSTFDYPVIYYGRIVASREATVSFERAGRLEAVHFDEGQSVSAGSPLARLDTAVLDAESNLLKTRRDAELAILQRLERGEREQVIAAARADVERAEAELERAKAEKERLSRIYAEQAVSQSRYDQARFELRAAIADVEGSRQRLKERLSGSREEDIRAQASRVAAIDAQLKQLEVQYGKSEIVAPFDSVVIRRMVDEGVALAAGQPVVAVQEAGKVEARFSVPPHHLALVAKASFLQIDDLAYPMTKPRAISRVDQRMRSVDIVVPLDLESHDRVLPGSTCSLTVNQTIDAECVVVPIDSLVASVRGLWSVYHLHEADSRERFILRKFDGRVLHTDGRTVVLETALPDEALIVARGAHRVGPGMTVRVSEMDSPDSSAAEASAGDVDP